MVTAEGIPARGDVRERVLFLLEQSVSDGMGGETAQWVDMESRWAKVKPVRGNEAVDGGRVAARQTYLVTARWDRLTSAITTADRIWWNGRELNIRTITNRDMRRRWLTFECEEGVAQ